ncbi:uncharacterized protein LOC126588987 [Malus sylvestris]|uniref:uncharacterized protein LOC126588987 n=1 Tax=Malus sylvestris TaxID=3752 RepID=UPI0021AD39CD|nr:uncharacterized protein LOC126588987 [Malus sylvestris]
MEKPSILSISPIRAQYNKTRPISVVPCLVRGETKLNEISASLGVLGETLPQPWDSLIPSLFRSFRLVLGPFRFAPPIYFFFHTLIYFFFPTACIQTKREKEKKEKKKSRRKRAKGKRFCYGLLGEKKMENLGQARTAVIDGSKVELGDLEDNFMEKSMVPEPLLWNCTIDVMEDRRILVLHYLFLLPSDEVRFVVVVCLGA